MPTPALPPPRPPRFWASVFGLSFGVFGTFLGGVATLLVGWLPWRRASMLWIARHWARLLLFFSGARSRARYAVPLDPGGRYVLLANHQSYFDIPALLAVVPLRVRFAAKRSLFRIPVFGWALAVGGFIPIDREDKSQAGKALAKAVSLLAAGESVLFFPEGTRSRDGSLGPFERGGFLVAIKAGLPIVPVGIRGARDVQPRGRYTLSPGTIEVAFGTPLDPAAYGVRKRELLMNDVRAQIVELGGFPDLPPRPQHESATGGEGAGVAAG